MVVPRSALPADRTVIATHTPVHGRIADRAEGGVEKVAAVAAGVAGGLAALETVGVELGAEETGLGGGTEVVT